MSAISEGVPPTKQSRKGNMAAKGKGKGKEAAEAAQEPEAPLDIWQDCLRKFDEDSAAAGEAAEGEGQGSAGANEPYTLFVLGA